jgi:predicted transcriptional regulator
LAASQKPNQQLCNALRNTNRNDKRRRAVPILKAPPKQSKNESLQLRVSAEFKSKLQRYAQFLEATPSYVVIEALDRIFAKDREFKTWLEQHAARSSEAQIEINSTMEAIRKA